MLKKKNNTLEILPPSILEVKLCKADIIDLVSDAFIEAGVAKREAAILERDLLNDQLLALKAKYAEELEVFNGAIIADTVKKGKEAYKLLSGLDAVHTYSCLCGNRAYKDKKDAKTWYYTSVVFTVYFKDPDSEDNGGKNASGITLQMTVNVTDRKILDAAKKREDDYNDAIAEVQQKVSEQSLIIGANTDSNLEYQVKGMARKTNAELTRMVPDGSEEGKELLKKLNAKARGFVKVIA